MNTNKPAIGIDLGTTYCCVGIWRNNTVEIILNQEGNHTTPSYVAFTDTDRMIGESAFNQAVSNPVNTIFNAKRLIGRKFSDPIVADDIKLLPYKVTEDNERPLINVKFKNQKREFYPEEISAMLLSQLKKDAESYLGEEVKDVVITVPAYFNDAQRRSTRDAGIIAGCNVLRIINEPTVAAIAYGFDVASEDSNSVQNVVVVDLGGGTFDVSLLRIENGVFEVKATAGDTHLGGEDFDNRVIQHFVAEFKTKYGIDLTKFQKPMHRLKKASEIAKRTLSTTNVATIELDSLKEDIDFSSQITRAKFEELCQEYFQSLLIPIEKVLRDSKLQKDQIDQVVLVGGSTRIPKVQSVIGDYFGKPPNASINPEEAVAWGAAVQAAVLSGQENDRLDKMLLIDVVPLSLGLETAGGLMHPIIKRNTSIPSRKKQLFSTYFDNQSSVFIQIYEGERPKTSDNNLLGRFELADIPPALRGVPKIEVVFDIDENGILSVSATDDSTGNQNKITIRNDKNRLSQADVERMIQTAERFRAEDQVEANVSDAKLGLQRYVFSILNGLTDPKVSKILDSQVVEKIRNAVDNTVEWLRESDKQDYTISDYESKQIEMEKISKPIKEIGISVGRPSNVSTLEEIKK